MVRSSVKRNVREDKVTSVSSKDNSNVTLSSGVVLSTRKINPIMVSDILSQFNKPSPPRLYIPDVGREEENPDDPKYLERLDDYQRESTMAIVDAMIVSGTEISFVPDDLQRMEDTDWRETLEASGIQISANPKKLYLTWVKHVACNGEDDINGIVDAVGRRMGVSENDVKIQTSLFRRRS
jgi:hypothetical protein